MISISINYAKTFERIHEARKAHEYGKARRIAVHFAIAHRFLAGHISKGNLLSPNSAAQEKKIAYAYARIARSLRPFCK